MNQNKLRDCLEGNGLKERMVEYLSAAYRDSKCEVKVGEMVSESFGVVNGLSQGCVLSPVLFALYIKSLQKN